MAAGNDIGANHSWQADLSQLPSGLPMGLVCCAQQTGMHILVVEALLIATYSAGRADTYTHKKTLSVENLSRANSWSLSSCACPYPAESLSSWPIPAVVYEPANSNR